MPRHQAHDVALRLAAGLRDGSITLGAKPIQVKRIAWDGWEAWCEECPLIRAKGPTAIAAVEQVRAQLDKEDETSDRSGDGPDSR